MNTGRTRASRRGQKNNARSLVSRKRGNSRKRENTDTAGERSVELGHARVEKTSRLVSAKNIIRRRTETIENTVDRVCQSKSKKNQRSMAEAQLGGFSLFHSLNEGRDKGKASGDSGEDSDKESVDLSEDLDAEIGDFNVMANPWRRRKNP